MVRYGVEQGPALTPAGAIGTTNLAERERWLEKALAALPPGVRILDAGAGEQQYRRFCGHLDYVSQNFGEYDGVGDAAGLQTSTWNNLQLDIVSDITQIPVPPASFDAVMCIEVFEHIPQPIAAIAEFARILNRRDIDRYRASFFADAFCALLFLQRIQPVLL